MPSNYIARFVDQHWHRPAPLPNRGRDLRHLFGAVRPGVTRIRHERGHGSAFNGVGGPAFARLGRNSARFLARWARFGNSGGQ